MRGKHRAKPQLASYLNVDARDFIKETPYQKFANNLKALMKKKGLKQVHIVTALGVPKGSVSSWCNGKNLPRAEAANRLAAFWRSLFLICWVKIFRKKHVIRRPWLMVLIMLKRPSILTRMGFLISCKQTNPCMQNGFVSIP